MVRETAETVRAAEAEAVREWAVEPEAAMRFMTM